MIKKILFLSMLILTSPLKADEIKNCLTEVELLEQKLKECKISYAKNASTADMNNATYASTDCAIRVAHQIFENYYSKTKDESKETLNQLVKAIYKHAHHLQQSSDFAQLNYTGTMYNLMAISTADVMIKDVVKSYIDEIKMECKDKF